MWGAISLSSCTVQFEPCCYCFACLQRSVQQSSLAPALCDRKRPGVWGAQGLFELLRRSFSRLISVTRQLACELDTAYTRIHCHSAKDAMPTNVALSIDVRHCARRHGIYECMVSDPQAEPRYRTHRCLVPTIAKVASKRPTQLGFRICRRFEHRPLDNASKRDKLVNRIARCVTRRNTNS
jgi:hypothetical protein